VTSSLPRVSRLLHNYTIDLLWGLCDDLIIWSFSCRLDL
jgi:hypothetical protein